MDVNIAALGSFAKAVTEAVNMRVPNVTSSQTYSYKCEEKEKRKHSNLVHKWVLSSLFCVFSSGSAITTILHCTTSWKCEFYYIVGKSQQ